MRFSPTISASLGLVGLLSATVSAAGDPPPSPTAVPAPAGSVSEAAGVTEPIGATIRARALGSGSKIKEEEAADWQALLALYEERNDEPVWTTAAGYTDRALALAAEMQKAGEWGLDASQFQVPPLAATGAELTRDVRLEAEQGFGLTLLKYARHARGGRITTPPKQLSSYLDRFPQYVDPKSLLDRVLTSSDAAAELRTVHPKHPQFERLRQAYLAMQASTASASTIVRVPAGPKLVPGQKHAQVALLRQRLGVALEPGADETLYDEALATAVKAFQQEKGARPDAIVGNTTRTLLNDIDAPSPDRLLANMEEWRWMPDNLGDFYVWVNIPEFMVRVVKNGAVIHEERVITGEVAKQTPIFSDALETINFHPRWIVPQSIKVYELYPSLARGGNTLTRQGLKLAYNGREVSPTNVDWSTADIRAFDVYQPSGPSNVLGVVKFLFPNKHGVYMHDTNAKGLFEEPVRTFSHGCMRVRNPQRLAEVLLEADKGWDPAKVAVIVDAKPEENIVELDHKIPVHVTYFTAWIDDQGHEQGFKDVYGHEKRITLALAGKWAQIERGPDHLAPVKFVRDPYAGYQDPFTALFGGFGGPAPSASQQKKSKSKSASGGLFDLFGGF